MRDIPEQYRRIIKKHRDRIVQAQNDINLSQDVINDVVNLIDLDEDEQVDLNQMMIVKEEPERTEEEDQLQEH